MAAPEHQEGAVNTGNTDGERVRESPALEKGGYPRGHGMARAYLGDAGKIDLFPLLDQPSLWQTLMVSE